MDETHQAMTQIILLGRMDQILVADVEEGLEDAKVRRVTSTVLTETEVEGVDDVAKNLGEKVV